MPKITDSLRAISFLKLTEYHNFSSFSQLKLQSLYLVADLIAKVTKKY